MVITLLGSQVLLVWGVLSRRHAASYASERQGANVAIGQNYPR